ncbi:MAG: hypothetical protein H0X13_15460 [Ramlibacter sp.]|nr:hypothetical protein [Ramlibacter sp.]
MTGLLDGVLPYLYSQGDRAKRHIGGLLDDPIGTARQYIGSLNDEAGRGLGLLDASGPPTGQPTQIQQKARGALIDQLGLAMIGAAGPVRSVADDAMRAAKIDFMGMERGWYRGGPELTGSARSGPWYTQDAQEAANYAKRFGPKADVREYAIPKNGFLNADSAYSHKLPNDVAAVLDDPYFDKAGASLARELRTFAPGEGITGGQLWQALESRFGNDGAAEVLQRLGSFKGAKGVTGGPEAYVFKGHPVRDAKKAAFDPAKYGVDDIYGRVNLPTLGILGGSALGLSILPRKE